LIAEPVGNVEFHAVAEIDVDDRVSDRRRRDQIERVSLAAGRPDDLRPKTSERRFNLVREKQIAFNDQDTTAVQRRCGTAVISRAEAVPERVEQNRRVARSLNEVDGRSYSAASVLTVDVGMLLGAPSLHGLEDCVDLTVVKGNKGLKHLRAFRSKGKSTEDLSSGPTDSLFDRRPILHPTEVGRYANLPLNESRKQPEHGQHDLAESDLQRR
jgi:hypothetical protein